MKSMKRNEQGFSLIELLVGGLIAALIGLAATAAIIQVVNAGRHSSHMSALRQVQDAGYWVSRDGLQAQAVSISAGTGFPLTLTWTDWDTNEVHQIVYSLQNMPSGGLKKLWRQESINGGGQTTTLVAQYIVASGTSCYWTDGSHHSFNFDVTATVGQQTELRTYEVRPRTLV
jgi:type II secretory pathway pseudopilin PulG